MANISAITPSVKNAKLAQVRIGGRVVATLSLRSIEQLGLAEGLEWSEEVAARVKSTAVYEKSLERATRWIDRRAMSEAEVRGKLCGIGCDGALVGRVVARLVDLRLIDDEALAKGLIDEMRAKKTVGPALLREKLMRRGIAEGLVEQVIRDGGGGRDEVSDAQTFARGKLSRMKSLSPVTQKRRLAGALSRRGFDQETIESVLEQIPMGE